MPGTSNQTFRKGVMSLDVRAFLRWHRAMQRQRTAYRIGLLALRERMVKEKA